MPTASEFMFLIKVKKDVLDNTGQSFSGPTLEHGLVALGLMAMLSFVTTALLLIFIAIRMSRWRHYYKENLITNQYIVLIIALLVADLFQASAFLVSWYWLNQKTVGNDTGACVGQAFLLHLGDIGSAFFVLAVGAHTCFQIGFSRRLDNRPFTIGVTAITILSLLLTIVAPVMHGSKVYQPSGAWCWIGQEHEALRLGTHYIWIFLVQGLCIILYGALFWKLSVARKTISSMNKSISANDQRIKRAAYLMAIYPVVYVALTLPLAAGRMALYAHRRVPAWTWIFAGCLMTSCGWVDCLLYVFTRRALLKDEFKASPGNTRHSYGDHSGIRHIPDWMHIHGRKHDSTDVFTASIRKSFYTSTEKVDDVVDTTDYGNAIRGRFSDRTNDSSTAVDPHSPVRSPSQARLKHNSTDIELGTFYNASPDGVDDPEYGSMSSESPIIPQTANSRDTISNGSRKASEESLNASNVITGQIISGPNANARSNPRSMNLFRKTSHASSPTPSPPLRLSAARPSPPASRTRAPDGPRVEVPSPGNHQHAPSSGIGGITVERVVNVQSRPKSEVSSISPTAYFQSGAWAH